jgi:hypothetical protein
MNRSLKRHQEPFRHIFNVFQHIQTMRGFMSPNLASQLSTQKIKR